MGVTKIPRNPRNAGNVIMETNKSAKRNNKDVSRHFPAIFCGTHTASALVSGLLPATLQRPRKAEPRLQSFNHHQKPPRMGSTHFQVKAIGVMLPWDLTKNLPFV